MWTTTYRGPLYIHAALTFDGGKEEKKEFLTSHPDANFGGVIGIVDLVDCVKNHPSRWAIADQFHWVLTNPREVEFVRMKGKLGLFYYQKGTFGT